MKLSDLFRVNARTNAEGVGRVQTPPLDLNKTTFFVACH